MTIKNPSFNFESSFWEKGTKVFGIDEVGRGSFAGPLVGAAVAFDKKFNKKWLSDIKDSKLLTHKERKRLSNLIKKNSEYFIESVDLDTINTIGIGKSNILLFERLIDKINKNAKNNLFLIDGRKNSTIENCLFLIKGDSTSISIAAASIVAKVYRDDLMRKLGKLFKGYNFYKNKGYGTKFHRDAIRKYGLSKVHRKSFNLNKFISS